MIELGLDTNNNEVNIIITDLYIDILNQYIKDKTSYTVIQTKNNDTIVLNNSKSFNEDIKLSATYNYKVSQLYYALFK